MIGKKMGAVDVKAYERQIVRNLSWINMPSRRNAKAFHCLARLDIIALKGTGRTLDELEKE